MSVPVLQSRLRKQDVGLKSHLQQLDQQISELKLDVSKASTEQMESDSRPSSGLWVLKITHQFFFFLNGKTV